MRTVWWPVLALVVLVGGCGHQVAETAGSDDPQRGGWERLPDPPLSGCTAAVVEGAGDLVYVVGGWEFLCPPNADCSGPDDPPFADGAVLDLRTGRWQPIADAPFGLRSAEAAMVGEDLYLMSGCRTGDYCQGRPELLRYDTGADRWDELGPVPGGKPWLRLQPWGEMLLVYPETHELGEQPDRLYDPANGEWRDLPDDPLPATYDRHPVVDGDRLLLFGSTLDGDGERDVKVGAALDLPTMRWSRLPDAPGSGYQVWRIGEDAWLNPHYGDGGGVLDLTTDTWRPFPDDPFGLSWEHDMAGVVGDGEAVYEYAAGWVRDTRTDSWLHVPERPGDAYDESLAAVGDGLVVFGGQRWDGDEGELVAETWVWRPPA